MDLNNLLIAALGIAMVFGTIIAVPKAAEVTYRKFFKKKKTHPKK